MRTKMEAKKTMLSPQEVGRSGVGSIVLHRLGDSVAFSELSYRYPLKLLSPRTARSDTGIVYILSYGGGLVGGDRISMEVKVESGANLLLLTQGSTKVFKSRTSNYAPSQADRGLNAYTTQSMNVHVCSNGLLLLLPDPVTCFASSSYKQIQTFNLEQDASVILLDWITSGRMSRGEEWAFSTYYSLNEVWFQDMRIARDALLFQNPSPGSLEGNIGESMRSYACYATVIMCGPQVSGISSEILDRYRTISVFQQSSPMPLVWSASRIHTDCVIMRVAGRETEMVKSWLKEMLKGVELLIGSDAYSKAFI